MPVLVNGKSAGQCRVRSRLRLPARERLQDDFHPRSFAEGRSVRDVDGEVGCDHEHRGDDVDTRYRLPWQATLYNNIYTRPITSVPRGRFEPYTIQKTTDSDKPNVGRTKLSYPAGSDPLNGARRHPPRSVSPCGTT